MNSSLRVSLLTCTLVSALASLVPQQAQASGLELPAPGSTRSGAARADAASVHYNPATLGFVERPTILASGGLLIGGARYTRERLARYQYADSFDFALPIDETNIDPSRTGVAEPVSATPVAPLGDLFWAQPLGFAPLTFGAGIYAPWGAVLNLPDDGAQKWVVQDVSILTTALTPSVAWRIIPELSVGVSMPFYVGRAELARVQDFAEISDVGVALSRPPINQPNDFRPDAPTGVRELDVLARPTVLKNAWAARPTFAAGITARPVDRVMLGLSYTHSAPLTFVGDIQIDMDDEFFTQDLASQGLRYPALVEGRGTLSFTLPWALRFGAVIDLTTAHNLMLNVSVVGWSTVREFDVRADAAGLSQPDLGLPPTASFAVPRNWNNTWDTEFVHSIQATESLMAWYGAGLHSPAPPDEFMDLAAIDGWRVTAVAGAGFQLSERVALLADAELQNMLPRRVASSRFDIGNGDYSLTLFRMAAHLQYTF
ncbi:MAG: outer membrane protein transport protein [Myxococcales bacterium]|nr:outer membrane protein transport protein [Myxococcales bacterium]